ncbi:monocarboxylate transporter 3-like isoform X2 [Odontomachus brunneus]|uniref:monocarboxylate transporter 3-like isoform X2 n=1 Tax=Odontomachus brunneus TaxID=486640 RepID=UPI0013F2912B|nr:monocarboxylate transporter 3-like isoform X2 [Odontomachus brunneus]
MPKGEEMSSSRESRGTDAARPCNTAAESMSTAKRKTKTKTVPPDGGWGWVVLFSALVVNFLIPGTVKSFGVLFVEFLHVFKASSTAASWMPALCYFLYSSLGPLSSILSTKYSYRTVTLIGGTFAASGMMLSYFANSVTYLYVSYGLMVGIGAGLSFPPTVYIVTSYFEKLRGVANGLCISGSAIGTIVLPPLLQYLLDCFGYRGAVLIMGAITLNTLVCGLLYHPVEQHMKTVVLDEGIDNEALTLDEPVDRKQEPDKRTGISVKFDSSFPDAHNDDDKRMYKLSDLQHNVVLQSINEKASCKPEENLAYEEDDEKCTTPKVQCDTEKKDLISRIQEDTPRKDTPDADDIRATICLSLASKDDGHGADSGDGENGSDALNLSRRNNTLRGSKTQFDSLKGAENHKEESNGRYVEESKRSDVCSKSSKEADKSEKTRFFDLSVLQDPIYLVILISNSTSAISNTNFMILLPSYAIAEGFDKNSSALLLSIVSALDLVGRIGGASLSDIDFIPKYYYFVGGLGTSGIALALLPMATSYTMLSFFCGLFGLSSGMYIGITTVILADMLGTEKLSSSYGISLFVNGVLQLVGPPVCGIIFENVLSYKPIFLAFGIILILGTALWAAVPIIKRNNKKDLEAI